MKLAKADLMAIIIARYLKDAESCFVGLASPVPTVSVLLARKLYKPDLIYLNIAGGLDLEELALTYSTVGPNMYLGGRSAFDLVDSFDLAARGGLDIAFLSCGQIDRLGRLNSSSIGDFRKPKVKLPGGAGSAVLIPTCKRGFVWKTSHDRRGLVEEVDFITAQGNVEYLFTPLSVFRLLDGRLKLDGLLPGSSLEEVAERTGFELEIHSDRVLADPTEEEVQALREIDPEGRRFIEFQGD